MRCFILRPQYNLQSNYVELVRRKTILPLIKLFSMVIDYYSTNNDDVGIMTVISMQSFIFNIRQEWFANTNYCKIYLSQYIFIKNFLIYLLVVKYFVLPAILASFMNTVLHVNIKWLLVFSRNWVIKCKKNC